LTDRQKQEMLVIVDIPHAGCRMKTESGLSQQIRSIARDRYVLPALNSGRTEFQIRVRNLINDARAQGLKTDQRTPQFCTSIQKEEFLQENGLEIVGVDGPPSKLSTTVVVHYRRTSSPLDHVGQSGSTTPVESPHERASRLAEKLRGILKDELAEYGGGEAFIRWMRSEDRDEA
jgi:hypothetical protein